MKDAIIILAAGKGSRLGLNMPKPLVPLAGIPLVHHVIAAAQKSHPEGLMVVVPPGGESWLNSLEISIPLHTCLQPYPGGTGHAVLCALEAFKALGDLPDTLIIITGDSPLIQASSITQLREVAQVSQGGLLTFYHTPPSSYGRVICSAVGYAEKILNDVPDHAETLCAAGALALPTALAYETLLTLKPQGPKAELYMTDLVEATSQKGLLWRVIHGEADEGLGVNTLQDLTEAQSALQRRWRFEHLAQGVLMQDPSTTFFSADTRIQPGALLSPYVIIGPGVRIDAQAMIQPFCVLSHVHIKSGSTVGPFAHLRAGCILEENSFLGSFVEAKNAHMGQYAKAKHMSYLGDITVGAGSTIGAGTVVCNYNGLTKHATRLGEDVFIGSHSTLVAPLDIQDRAFIGAGSVVTRPIPEKALAVSRSPLKIFPRRAKSCKTSRPSQKV